VDESIKITGLKETQKAIYQYGQKIGDFVVYKALFAGAALVRKQAAANAPVYKGPPRNDKKPGTLRRGFRVKKSKIHDGKFSTDMIGVYLTLKKGKGKKDLSDPYYGRWQELGWNTAGAKSSSRLSITSTFGKRTGRKTGVGRTNVPGKFFMANAFTTQKNAAADTIVRVAENGLALLAQKEGL
jgi:hypothetical protein